MWWVSLSRITSYWRVVISTCLFGNNFSPCPKQTAPVEAASLALYLLVRCLVHVSSQRNPKTHHMARVDQSPAFAGTGWDEAVPGSWSWTVKKPTNRKKIKAVTKVVRISLLTACYWDPGSCKISFLSMSQPLCFFFFKNLFSFGWYILDFCN